MAHYAMNQEGSAKRVPRALLSVAAGPQGPECMVRINEDPEDRRTPTTAFSVHLFADFGGIDQERGESVCVGGRRSAGTGVYVRIHEDSEHRRTPTQTLSARY
jgi:hypothetical protein